LRAVGPDRGGCPAVVLAEDPFVNGFLDRREVVFDLDARVLEALHDFLRSQR
jgi:hypothetical protein